MCGWGDYNAKRSDKGSLLEKMLFEERLEERES